MLSGDAQRSDDKGADADDDHEMHVVKWWLPGLAGLIGLFVVFLITSGINSLHWFQGTFLTFNEHRVHQIAYADVGLLSANFNGTVTDLSTLCLQYGNSSVWCDAEKAGTRGLYLLWVAWLPGTLASLMSIMLSLRCHPDKIQIVIVFYRMVKERLGVDEDTQYRFIMLGWATLWFFLFCSLIVYSASIPSTLGYGPTELDWSFGLLRVSFLLVTICTTVLSVDLFELWDEEAVVAAWDKMHAAKRTEKTAYRLLLLQLFSFLIMAMQRIEWQGLLIIFALYYLDSKADNFFLLYVGATTISLLFDLMYLCGLPEYKDLQPPQQVSNFLYTCVFVMKFFIIVLLGVIKRTSRPSRKKNPNQEDLLAKDRDVPVQNK